MFAVFDVYQTQRMRLLVSQILPIFMQFVIFRIRERERERERERDSLGLYTLNLVKDRKK